MHLKRLFFFIILYFSSVFPCELPVCKDGCKNFTSYFCTLESPWIIRFCKDCGSKDCGIRSLNQRHRSSNQGCRQSLESLSTAQSLEDQVLQTQTVIGQYRKEKSKNDNKLIKFSLAAIIGCKLLIAGYQIYLYRDSIKNFLKKISAYTPFANFAF